MSGTVTSGLVAVTGASGFIGRYLCADLEAAGYRVRRLGRSAPEMAEDRQTDYSRDSLTAALEGVDAVIHLAGRRMTREDAPMDLAPFWEPNVAVIGDLVAAAQANGVSKIVLASTIAVYSAGSGLPYRESAPTRPINAYALSKLMAEQHLEMQTRAKGPAAVSLRLAAVYGHGEKGTPALMKFIGLANAGETIVLTGNADYRIDQLYVRDATSAFLAALRGVATGVYNIGGGRAVPVGEIAETVNDVFGNVGNIRYDTDSDAPMPKNAMALDEAQHNLDWEPAYDLRAGLADFRQAQENAG
ncbi:NAD-dependent epimerase/dehydratase family protein [Falsiruegeria litorea]|uniref:NAD(P)-dependent oxidoreductase n=1 Tax=Falsiruegeria litorea TaxID=1280831 RepID=A0ABS5WRK8_9RHOB|nr:NAD(P)-dependent oxidoreductase [Falsiruegeria litorea]MBT3141772.1 NAD(P)-dependent oxidoreductase [Falsiruegeria litorea]MBT8167148.1 NAD(P)-dependent oxidoreductase [Falsiruegeria litorea]